MLRDAGSGKILTVIVVVYILELVLDVHCQAGECES